jgi:hypothetical protein
MHPDEHIFLLYLEGRAQPGERDIIEEHSAHCERCAHLLATLSRLQEGLNEPVPIEPDQATFSKAVELVRPRGLSTWFHAGAGRSPLGIALAGAAVLAIALTTYVFLPRHEDERFRSERDGLLPVLKLVPSDGAVVRETSPEFRWNNVQESAVYRFNLLDASGTVIWSNDVRDTSLSLPPSVVLQPGITYLWSVETLLADHSPGRFTLHAFTYSPPP